MKWLAGFPKFHGKLKTVPKGGSLQKEPTKLANGSDPERITRERVIVIFFLRRMKPVVVLKVQGEKRTV